jgi:hypothetical protein
MIIIRYRINRSALPAPRFHRTELLHIEHRTRLLESGYFESQTWGALHKAWKGYVIAKNKYEFELMEYYASVIQKLQKELGLRISSFPELGLIPQLYDEAYDDHNNFRILQ